MAILGIETSCDETGIAIYEQSCGLMANKLYSQVEQHARFGGVVPELASRDHVRKILPLVKETLLEAKMQLTDLEAIAYTAGPGLVGALMVGAAFACALGFSLNIPTIPIHHLEGHLLAPLLEPNPPDFPFLALLVSGGHTQLIEARSFGSYRLLGETLDDAIGEAFDKVAKILKLPYPGGPKLAKLAEQGDSSKFFFPRPMADHSDLNFSFSGLKTHALNCYRRHESDLNGYADIAAAFQDAATDAVVIKCRQALRYYKFSTLVVAGGVSANLSLRNKLNNLGLELGVRVCYPRLEFCTDNGAMIAYAGWRHFIVGKTKMATNILVEPRWKL